MGHDQEPLKHAPLPLNHEPQPRPPQRLLTLALLLPALGGLSLSGAVAGEAPRRSTPGPRLTPGATPTPGPSAPAHPAPPPAAVAEMSDAEFCGITPPTPDAAELRCPQPGLPCGPVELAGIGSGTGDPQEDLDGDGRPDLTLAGRTGGKPGSFGAVYLDRPGGFVLVDYHAVAAPADPQVAQVALAVPHLPPLVRDGHDVPLQGGRTLSLARLRRFDGGRFRTLLSFCAHRTEPLPQGGAREGHNRVDFVDVDGDGDKEIVLSGLLRPVVYRLRALSLTEDPALTERFRRDSPAERKARALRAEAQELNRRGEWRRAAAALGKAYDMVPYQADLAALYGEALLKIGQPEQALPVLQKAERAAPEQAAPVCALAQVYQALDDDDEEGAWERCLQRDPPVAARRQATARLAELRAARTPPDGGAGPPERGGDRGDGGRGEPGRG